MIIGNYLILKISVSQEIESSSLSCAAKTPMAEGKMSNGKLL